MLIEGGADVHRLAQFEVHQGRKDVPDYDGHLTDSQHNCQGQRLRRHDQAIKQILQKAGMSP